MENNYLCIPQAALGQIENKFSCRSFALTLHNPSTRILVMKNKAGQRLTGMMALVAVAFFLFASCSKEEGSTIAGFATAEVTETTPLTNGKDSPKCTISMKMKYASDCKDSCRHAINAVLCRELLGYDSDDVPHSVENFAKDYAANYKGSMAKLFAADRNDRQKWSWYEHSYSMETNVEEGRRGIIVYTASIDYNEGGAHGIAQTLTFNFDKQSGRLIKLGDVFVPEAEKRLTEMLQEKLEASVGAKNLDELKDKGYLNTTDMYVPQNFILGSNDITFIYNVYEIAPYEHGVTKLSIDYSDVKGLLAKDFAD
jgi:hypothetical protein